MRSKQRLAKNCFGMFLFRTNWIDIADKLCNNMQEERVVVKASINLKMA